MLTVTPGEPGVFERASLRLEQQAVGRECELVDALEIRQHADELEQVFPEQRLASGQAYFVDTEPGENADETPGLLEAEMSFRGSQT